MQANINVKIPDECFISADPSTDYPCEFSFTLTYGYIPDRNFNRVMKSTTEAVKYPQITISEFNKLIPDSGKLKDFKDNLKESGDSDWTVVKNNNNSDIIIRYTGDKLTEDFYFMASTDSLVAGIRENGTVNLTVTVTNFDGIEDNQYTVSTKVYYAPWAKSIEFSTEKAMLNSEVKVSYDYDGDNVDKLLMQNGQEVTTSESPYTALISEPSLFTLLVFSQWKMMHMMQKFIDVYPPEIKSFTSNKNYFSPGDKITLEWEVTSSFNVTIDNINDDTDVAGQGSLDVYPQRLQGTDTVTYTLRANGYADKHPTLVSKSVTLTATAWKNMGKISCADLSTALDNLNYNSRILTYKNNYFCYTHPNLYISEDGLVWEKHSVNNCADADFICLATGLYEDTIYAMGKNGKTGADLFVSRYAINESKWYYESAIQKCHSDLGSFSFSKDRLAYVQIIENGIMLSRRGEDGNWDAGNSCILAPTGKKVIGGDYCFYRNTFYAVMLCDDGFVYAYDCDPSMQSILFHVKVHEEDTFVNLIPTANTLYAVTAHHLVNLTKETMIDKFSPMQSFREKRMWVGINIEDKLMGIYPDAYLWIFDP